MFDLAHQGGWDEILMVAGPLLVFGGVLWLANKRANERIASATAAQGESEVEPGGLSSDVEFARRPVVQLPRPTDHIAGPQLDVAANDALRALRGSLALGDDDHCLFVTGVANGRCHQRAGIDRSGDEALDRQAPVGAKQAAGFVKTALLTLGRFDVEQRVVRDQDQVGAPRGQANVSHVGTNRVMMVGDGCAPNHRHRCIDADDVEANVGQRSGEPPGSASEFDDA